MSRVDAFLAMLSPVIIIELCAAEQFVSGSLVLIIGIAVCSNQQLRMASADSCCWFRHATTEARQIFYLPPQRPERELQSSRYVVVFPASGVTRFRHGLVDNQESCSSIMISLAGVACMSLV